jgi:type II secretory pathway pseudopilin PulG
MERCLELLIVVIILAVLAAIVVPQFGSSTEDAKISTLKANLASMRNAIELYYHQHDSTYPGTLSETDGTTATDSTTCPTAFVAPQSLPANPFIDTAVAVNIMCDTVEDDITAPITVDPSKGGWKIYTYFGRFIANDNTTLSDGTKTSTF